MAASGQRVAERKQSGEETSHSTSPMSFTSMEEFKLKTDCLHLRNGYDWLDKLLSCDGQTDTLTRNASETCDKSVMPLKLSDTNPFKADVDKDFGTDVRCKEPRSHIHNHRGDPPAVPLIATIATPSTNPFAAAHSGSFIHSTPVPCHSPRPMGSHSHRTDDNSLKNVNNVEMPSQSPLPIYEQHKSHARRPHSKRHQVSSESEDEYDSRERIPILRPGQYDGTTPGGNSCTGLRAARRRTAGLKRPRAFS